MLCYFWDYDFDNKYLKYEDFKTNIDFICFSFG